MSAANNILHNKRKLSETISLKFNKKVQDIEIENIKRNIMLRTIISQKSL
jgi:hypothetical protein